jgi:DNA ligase-1
MLGDVADAFAAVAEAAGSGSRRLREARLTELAARATAEEREFLGRIIGGELRTGVSEGLVLEAVAAAAGADLGAVRRAALFLGDLSAVAELARAGGPAALAGAAPRPFVPLLPMLAEIADDPDGVLRAHGGRTALEFKYDGARVQVHRAGERVGIWTRRLSDVTRSLPDVVAAARGYTGEPFILDGEVVALDAAGRPLPFQELMRRFRRVHGVEALAREMPLALHFFDCLMVEGHPLVDAPYAARWEALARVTGGRDLAERTLASDADTARAFSARSLAAGHEGLMAKDLTAGYEPGGRGKRWFKLKAAQTIDCVIIAADRGSGRRVGWLSNYHLAVREGEGFADVGKTFKGLTDAEFTAMTERLRALAVDDDGYTVRVRPQVVVEVEYNEIQRSPTYPSGLALRFARIARLREDKGPGQATTLEELRGLYERQFATKGRGGRATEEP